jgi:NAD(P)-dependent dehydrogenase (short-subunit alcohol dehydrogenase family)
VRLEGKVAVVTGGARGFGRGIVERFAAEGARVVVADLLEDEGGAVVRAVERAGGSARFLRTDVTVGEQMATLVAFAEETFGKLDVMVGNAGVLVRAGLEEITEEQYRTQFDVNVKGTWLACKHAIPAMRRAGGGSIVLTASAAAYRALLGSPLYGASKAAIVMLAKNTALGVAHENIRCNAVAPGPVANEFYGFSDAEMQAWVDRFSPDVPMGWMGESIDVANAALFLASDEARWVTGTVLGVDGGFTL